MIKFSVNSDLNNIRLLLNSCNLPTKDIENQNIRFLIKNEDDQLKGVIGIEAFGETGLLRSFAVEKNARSQGIGKELYKQLLDYCRQTGIKYLYLLTDSAEKYFSELGFERENRSDVPEVIKQTEEFSSICPVSSVCMKKEI